MPTDASAFRLLWVLSVANSEFVNLDIRCSAGYPLASRVGCRKLCSVQHPDPCRELPYLRSVSRLFDGSWATEIIREGLLVALAARPDADEQAVDSRFRRYPVPALTEVVTCAAVVLLSAGSGPSLRTRLADPAHTPGSTTPDRTLSTAGTPMRTGSGDASGVTVVWQRSPHPRHVPGKAVVSAVEVTGNPGFSTRSDRLRRSLTELGLNVDEIAAALSAELRLRSRAAYRYAVGMSGQAAAEVYNARFGTSQSPAPMSKTRISEYENWPIGRNTRRPSPTVLHNLADVYGTSPRKLLDHHDLAALTEQQRHSLLTPAGRPLAPQGHGQPRRKNS